MLDNRQQLDQIDSEGMLAIYEHYVQHFREALRLSEKALDSYQGELPGLGKGKINNILIAGMGGSAIGGDVLRAIYMERGPLPITVSRSYELPGFIGRDSLVLVTSYSGNTAETLSAYKKAVEQKATLVTISSGGKLAKLAAENGHLHITIPGGIQPRCALPYLLFPALCVLNRAGYQPQVSFDFLDALEEYIAGLLPGNPRENNVAKQLAGMLGGKMLFLYGPEHLEPAMKRFATQVHENAETHAFWNVFPELCHNEIVAWGNSELVNEKFIVLFRDRRREARSLQTQIDLAQELVLEEKATVLEIKLREESFILNLLYAVVLGDLVSIYMAILRDIDPSPVRVIERLKREMKKA